MEKKVEFKQGSDTIRGSIFVPKGVGPFPAVIFFHGSGGAGEMYFETAKILAEKGILGFAVNYRGAGVSSGNMEDQTIQMGIDDSRAAVDFLLSQEEVDKDSVGVCGGSFGGFVAATLSSNFDFKSIILSAPASYSPEIISTKNRDSDDLRDSFKASDSYKNIAHFKGSLLIIKCELDDVLPDGMVDKYFEVASEARKKELFILKGAKHRISINPEAKKLWNEKVLEWFLQTL